MIFKPILLVSNKKPQSRLFLYINTFIKEVDNTGMEEKVHAAAESRLQS